MGEALVHIQIHFGDKLKNYIAPYTLVDDDESLLFTPYMFKDVLNEWICGDVRNFIEIPISELRQRLGIFRSEVSVPIWIVSKLESMIKYIERHDGEYAGISLVC
jgi:midasin (ATPase involved in ribosome maturation)